MLPAQVETLVTQEFLDSNGHMNIRHYLELDARSTIVLVEGLGIDDTYRANRRMGVFTAEHHLRYYFEMHLGGSIAVHAQVLQRSSRAVHMMAYLTDTTQHRLANTLELILVHVDMDSRRPVEMPDDIAEGFDRFMADTVMPWSAPTCGVMGIRPR